MLLQQLQRSHPGTAATVHPAAVTATAVRATAAAVPLHTPGRATAAHAFSNTQEDCSLVAVLILCSGCCPTQSSSSSASSFQFEPLHLSHSDSH